MNISFEVVAIQCWKIHVYVQCLGIHVLLCHRFLNKLMEKCSSFITPVISLPVCLTAATIFLIIHPTKGIFTLAWWLYIMPLSISWKATCFINFAVLKHGHPILQDFHSDNAAILHDNKLKLTSTKFWLINSRHLDSSSAISVNKLYWSSY